MKLIPVQWPLMCALGAALFLALGCASRPAGSSTASIDEIAQIEPGLSHYPYLSLLTFENDSDALFLIGATGKIVSSQPHAGKASFRLDPSTSAIEIKLSSLTSGMDFPGKWTLVGGFVYCQQPTGIVISLMRQGRVIARNALQADGGNWTPVMVDLTTLPQATSDSADSLAFSFDRKQPGDIWCDDVMLVNNSQTLVEGKAPWSIRKAGLGITGERKGSFSFRLLSADASPDGWNTLEANVVRARFQSNGPQKNLTIYADGRSYWDSQFKAIARMGDVEQTFELQHHRPAKIEVKADQGRVNRTSAGDENNDGYNERTGAYQVIASGKLVEVTLTPRTGVLVWPVIEVEGLPAGAVTVTAEGRLIEGAIRLRNGDVLCSLPVEMERATTISIRVD